MTKTNESAENYLETILTLSKELPVVRSIDIAHELNFAKASVSIKIIALIIGLNLEFFNFISNSPHHL